MNHSHFVPGRRTGTARGRGGSRGKLVRWIGLTMLGLFALGLMAELLLPA